MRLGLLPIQLVMLVIWYTVAPSMPAWLVWLPTLIIGVILGAPLLLGLALMLGAGVLFVIAACLDWRDVRRARLAVERKTQAIRRK